MTNLYTTGQLVRISGAFTALDVDGVTYVARDPTVVTVSYRAPDGTTTELVYGEDAAVVRESVGHYHADISTSLGGEYWFRFAGTGAAEAAGEDSFYVRPTNVPPAPPPAP